VKDFITNCGKKPGTIKNSELSSFFDRKEFFIRQMKKRSPLQVECLYLGAFCKANNITKEDLLKVLEEKEKIK